MSGLTMNGYARVRCSYEACLYVFQIQKVRFQHKTLLIRCLGAFLSTTIDARHEDN